MARRPIPRGPKLINFDPNIMTPIRAPQGPKISPQRPNIDIASIEERLKAIEGIKMPQVDLSGIEQRLKGLEGGISNIPQFDPSALQQQIGSLQQQIGGIPQFDPSALQQQIGGLQQQIGEIPQFDPSGLQQQISGLETTLGNIPAPQQIDRGALIKDIQSSINIPAPQQFDPTGLQSRLGALESREAFDPTGLQTQISELQGREAFDPSGLQSQIAANTEGLQRQQMTQLPSIEQMPQPVEQMPQPIGQEPQPMMPPIPRTDGMIGDLPPDVGVDISPPAPQVIPPAPQVIPPTETTPPPDTAPVTTGTAPAPATSSVAQAPGPYAAGVKQVATKLDPLTEQLLFGIGGKGGFIPGAMRASEKVFYDDQGQPIVIDERVADFSPDQLAAMQMQRESLGMQDPYLQTAAGAYGSGTQALEEGLQRGRTAAIGSLEATRGGVGSLQRGLGESADILRGTIGGYDPSMTDRFYDPYEDRVVQQTISDIMERGAQGDIAARAGDIARGGESAFGSRARLGASERQEALGRGLAEAVSGIRSRGFSEAQRTGLGEFARQRAAERAASSGLAGLATQGFGGSQALAGALSGLGGTEQQIGQQRYSGQFGLGSSLQGLGAQAAGASASDIASLYGMGTQQQGQAQQMLDAQRRNLQQRQMTPLLQYQALQPFVSMAPAGQFQTITDFAPKPSATQIGIGTGLSTFGALGNLYGSGKT
jgi:hypothetical protein